jgi:hypothetical protein
MNMPKGKTKPEIYLLLDRGIKPKALIKIGFKPSIVYNYNKKYKIAKAEFDRIMNNNVVGV